MKKLLALIVSMACLSGFVFAQSTSDIAEYFKTEMSKECEIIIPEDQHVTNKTAKVELQYWPGTHELRLRYTCHAVSFDQGEAMNTALAVYKDFVDSHPEYYGYKYMRKDDVKYYKDEKTGFRWAVYNSYIVLTK